MASKDNPKIKISKSKKKKFSSFRKIDILVTFSHEYHLTFRD